MTALSSYVWGLEAQIQQLAAEHPCPNYGEATESCDCLLCRTQTVLTEWEDDPRFGAAASTQPPSPQAECTCHREPHSEIADSPVEVSRAPDCPVHSSPQAEVQDCEVELQRRIDDEARRIASEHALFERNSGTPNPTTYRMARERVGKQSPAEPQGDVVEKAVERAAIRAYNRTWEKDDLSRDLWCKAGGATQAHFCEQVRPAVEDTLAAITPLPPGSSEGGDLEDQYDRCDNCERLTAEDDLKVIWCKDQESGEQVDARICLVCRLEAERDQAGSSYVRERLRAALQLADDAIEALEWLQDQRPKALVTDAGKPVAERLKERRAALDTPVPSEPEEGK
jgi:hypothetical protein